MSIHLGLDESVVTVAPSLDDVEPLLIIRSRYRTMNEGQGVNGLVRKVSTKSGKARYTTLNPTLPEEGKAIYETRIPSPSSEGFTEYEVKTVYLAGGAGTVFFATDRRVRFATRWYGQNNRYLELRVQVSPSAEIIANRGMASFHEEDAQCNYLGQMRKGGWAEVHFDNQTHVGLSMSLHTADEDFTAMPQVGVEPVISQVGTRWEKLLSNRYDLASIQGSRRFPAPAARKTSSSRMGSSVRSMGAPPAT